MTRNEKSTQIDSAVAAFDKRLHEFNIFTNGIHTYFASHPDLNRGVPPVVHSVKSRVKDLGHLREKLNRKWDESGPFTPDNLFEKITDLAGVRVLHLYQDQFRAIHQVIERKVEERDWVLSEQAKAYTWDPESVRYFEQFGLDVRSSDTFYTSIHYLIRPRADSYICCELQVRTLFEEIWGEVDHSLNYPHPTSAVACREQLRVLAKLVGAGSRLVDSIFRTALDADS